MTDPAPTRRRLRHPRKRDRGYVTLARWKEFGGINRLALLPDFEMQLDCIRIRVAHFGNFLSFCYRLSFLDRNRLVMRIRRQQGTGVLDDDQIAVTTNTTAGIHHLAGPCGQYRLS